MRAPLHGRTHAGTARRHSSGGGGSVSLLLLLLLLLPLCCCPSAAAYADATYHDTSDANANAAKKNHVLPFPLRPGDEPVEYALPLGHALSAQILIGTDSASAVQDYEMRIGWPATGPGKFRMWVDDTREVEGMGIEQVEMMEAAAPMNDDGSSSSSSSSSSSGSSGGSSGGDEKMGAGGGRASAAADARTQLRRRRRLLNADKVVFRGNNNDHRRKELWGHVVVEPEGVSWDPAIARRPVRFNVLVEELVFLGVLPARVKRLVLFLGVALTLGVGVGQPALRRFLARRSPSSPREQRGKSGKR